MKNLKNGWNGIAKDLQDKWKYLPLIPEGSKEPVIKYGIPDETKQSLINRATTFVVENQMELNKENVEQVFQMMKRDLIVESLPQIIKSVSEKVRSLTAEEYDKIYENPSITPNTDQPDHIEEESVEDAIYEAEKKALSGE